MNVYIIAGLPVLVMIIVKFMKPKQLESLGVKGGKIVSALFIKYLGPVGQQVEDLIQIRLKALFDGFYKGLDKDDKKEIK